MMSYKRDCYANQGIRVNVERLAERGYRELRTQGRLQDLGDSTQDTKSGNEKRTFTWKGGHVWKAGKAGYYIGCFRCGNGCLCVIDMENKR